MEQSSNLKGEFQRENATGIAFDICGKLDSMLNDDQIRKKFE